jgi:tryptophan-rich sensory protein
MTQSILRQIAVVITTVVTIAVNTLANALPINGLTTGDVSAMYPVLFTPAGYVFSIWSVIYLGLIVFSVYQALPAQRDNPRFERIGWLYVLSGVLNSVWIILFHNLLIPATLIVMVGLLLSLIAVYLRLGVGVKDVPTAEKWTTHIPFSIYLGWVTVATITNTSVVLFDLGWNGFGLSAEFWTIALIGAATLISLGVALTRGDAAYLFVPVWAFVGIAVARDGITSIVSAAIVAAIIIAVMALLSLVPKGPFPLTDRRRMPT